MTSVCQSSRMLLWGTSINDIWYFLVIFAPSPLTLPTLPDNFYHATSNFLRYFWPLCSLPIPKSDIIYGISLIKTAALSNKCHTFVVGLLSWSFQAWYNILHSWAKFKIVLVRKPEGKLYSFHEKFCQNTIFGSSGFSFQFLISKFQGSGFSFKFLNSIL